MTYRVHYTITTDLSAEDDFMDITTDSIDDMTNAVRDALTSRGLDLERNAVWTEDVTNANV
jgi:hypothetical protein